MADSAETPAVEADEPVVIDDHGRPEPPIDAGEVATLLGFLDYQRATLRWKCEGVGTVGFRATTAATTMTLGGLLSHMAWVEDHWFSRNLHANDPAPPWNAVDWKANPDWEWETAADRAPDHLRELWEGAVERSRALVAEALAEGQGLDFQARRTWPDGRSPNLRWIVTHMIEEYARHNGHADLLREAIDGATGE
ncbi:MAG TPA: DinB family protein [Acidimicrobiales bacterium]